MRYRKLGNTGLEVSEIGFGTIPILSGKVPVLPEYFSPDTDEAVKIMEHAYNMGCNFYDTAIPEEYGDAEYKLGRFAEKVGRDNIIISDKARFFSGNEIYNAVIKSTENLGTYPDIYFVHQVDLNNQDITFERYGAVDALCDLKKEGRIKFTGIATHYYDVMLRAENDSRVDVIQGSGNIMERGMLERIRSFSGKKGFILNKVYGAGVLIDPFSPDELISGILDYPFSCALIGIGNFYQADIAMKHEYTPKNFTFSEVINRLKTKFEPVECDRCQRCVCPHGTEIHTIFRQYNYYHLGKNFWALKKLSLNIEQAYRKCLCCTEHYCEKNCPNNLHIPELIGKADSLVKNHIDYDFRNLF
ncbi:MAG: aldo/keto reductase [Ruminococcus sp.]|nr:aldo/keto reductase [Ruminococcus sp.]